jgi:hypothetical protein
MEARHDAVLILPGFGYGSGDDRPFRAVAASAAADGIDVYVARYLTRGGLESSRGRLLRFIRDERLDRYERLHVFAFLAGAWTLNPAIARSALPNLASVVYDRSPFQERAPILAARDLRIPAWLRYGSTLFDVARTPYPPLVQRNVRVGILVETKPTKFMRHHAAKADALGPFAFGCDGLAQRYDDCAYVALSHDELYERFASVWPDVETFIHTGRFGAAAVRTAPADAASRLSRR